MDVTFKNELDKQKLPNVLTVRFNILYTQHFSLEKQHCIL